MNISYIEPLRRAWARARRMLFEPFRVQTWLVLGFAAFLSEGLMTGRGGQFNRHRGGTDLADHWFHGLGGFLSGSLWAGIGLLVCAAILIVVVLTIWINSRGRFIFLDDVARERTDIVEPWNRFARLGNSLFFWLLGFSLVCIAVVVAIALPFIATLAMIWRHGFNWGVLGALWMLFAVAIPFGILAAYVLLLLSDFVVPIMLQHGLGVTAAWKRFLSLFRAHTGSFLLYGLFVFVLWLIAGVAITVIGLMSCCIGFVLFALPYVGSVVLLPLLVTFRALGPEFLAQFGSGDARFANPSGPAGGGVPPAPAPAASVQTPAPPPNAPTVTESTPVPPPGAAST